MKWKWVQCKDQTEPYIALYGRERLRGGRAICLWFPESVTQTEIDFIKQMMEDIWHGHK